MTFLLAQENLSASAPSTRRCVPSIWRPSSSVTSRSTNGCGIPGTALFFTREATVVPPYVIHCMLRSNIVYERNIFISIDRTDTPFGITTSHQPDLGPGLEGFTVTAGYMELLDLDGLLKANSIKEKVIFYATAGRSL